MAYSPLSSMLLLLALLVFVSTACGYCLRVERCFYQYPELSQAMRSESQKGYLDTDKAGLRRICQEWTAVRKCVKDSLVFCSRTDRANWSGLHDGLQFVCNDGFDEYLEHHDCFLHPNVETTQTVCVRTFRNQTDSLLQNRESYTTTEFNALFCNHTWELENCGVAKVAAECGQAAAATYRRLNDALFRPFMDLFDCFGGQSISTTTVSITPATTLGIIPSLRSGQIRSTGQPLSAPLVAGIVGSLVGMFAIAGAVMVCWYYHARQKKRAARATQRHVVYQYNNASAHVAFVQGAYPAYDIPVAPRLAWSAPPSYMEKEPMYEGNPSGIATNNPATLPAPITAWSVPPGYTEKDPVYQENPSGVATDVLNPERDMSNPTYGDDDYDVPSTPRSAWSPPPAYNEKEPLENHYP